MWSILCRRTMFCLHSFCILQRIEPMELCNGLWRASNTVNPVFCVLYSVVCCRKSCPRREDHFCFNSAGQLTTRVNGSDAWDEAKLATTNFLPSPVTSYGEPPANGTGSI